MMMTMMMKVMIDIHITDNSTTIYLSIHPFPSALPPSASEQILKVPLPEHLGIPPPALLPPEAVVTFHWMLGTASQPKSPLQSKLREANEAISAPFPLPFSLPPSFLLL